MAFKNILDPNVAICGNFKKTTEGFGTYGTGPVISLDTTLKYYRECSIRAEIGANLKAKGLQLSNFSNVVGGTLYSNSLKINGYGTFRMYIMQYNGSTFLSNLDCGTKILSGNWDDWIVSKTLSASATKAKFFITSELTTATYFNLGLCQFEQGNPTTWEFPGVDLTGNSIPSNTLINNIKLENIIRAFGIESTEQVNNLTLQNILTLTNISSEEYVNNIELLNEIILEAIENTTSVHDAVIYIKCNYMNVKFEMKYPSTSFKLKQPHTAFKMKYP